MKVKAISFKNSVILTKFTADQSRKITRIWKERILQSLNNNGNSGASKKEFS